MTSNHQTNAQRKVCKLNIVLEEYIHFYALVYKGYPL